jgi:hypothetical protein
MLIRRFSSYLRSRSSSFRCFSSSFRCLSSSFLCLSSSFFFILSYSALDNLGSAGFSSLFSSISSFSFLFLGTTEVRLLLSIAAGYPYFSFYSLTFFVVLPSLSSFDSSLVGFGVLTAIPATELVNYFDNFFSYVGVGVVTEFKSIFIVFSGFSVFP